MYLDNGYIDIGWIDRQAQHNNVNFILIIGKRQVGKTYGVLQYMLVNNKIHILLRRSLQELRFISVDVNNPYSKIPEGNNVILESQSEYTRAIVRDGDNIGMATALSCIASMRGFNGERYIELVYDECIPEKHVKKFSNERDAFLNAYVTISGNRELEGQKPLRCWLLANTNDINAPIIMSFGIAEHIAMMQREHKQYSILRDRGIMIVLCDSDVITQRRSETAIYKAIGFNNEFSKMSLGAEFAYNDLRNIRNNIDIEQYNLIAVIDDNIAMYVHKSKDLIHFTKVYSKHKNVSLYTKDMYVDFLNNYVNTIVYIRNGRVTFSSVDVKQKVFDFLRIKM